MLLSPMTLAHVYLHMMGAYAIYSWVPCLTVNGDIYNIIQCWMDNFIFINNSITSLTMIVIYGSTWIYAICNLICGHVETNKTMS